MRYCTFDYKLHLVLVGHRRACEGFLHELSRVDVVVSACGRDRAVELALAVSADIGLERSLTGKECSFTFSESIAAQPWGLVEGSAPLGVAGLERERVPCVIRPYLFSGLAFSGVLVLK